MNVEQEEGRGVEKYIAIGHCTFLPTHAHTHTSGFFLDSSVCRWFTSPISSTVWGRTDSDCLASNRNTSIACKWQNTTFHSIRNHPQYNPSWECHRVKGVCSDYQEENNKWNIKSVHWYLLFLKYTIVDYWDDKPTVQFWLLAVHVCCKRSKNLMVGRPGNEASGCYWLSQVSQLMP